MSIKLFEECCEKISLTTKRAEKEEILKQYITDFDVKALFRYALDPTLQFKTYFEEEGQPFQTLEGLSSQDILNELTRLMGGNKLTDEPANCLLDGKWIRKVVNKALNIGVGIKTVNKYLIPQIPEEYPMAHAQDIVFGDDPEFDSWAGMYNHLANPKDWVIQPLPSGVRVHCAIRDGKASFYSRFGTPIRNTEIIEKELLAVINEPVVLDGYLCSVKDDRDLSEDTFYRCKTPTDPVAVSLGIFFIMESVSDEPFQTRYSKLLQVNNNPLSNHQVVLAEPVNYTDDRQHQLNLKASWAGSLLRNSLVGYQAGKNPDMLRIKVKKTKP